MRAIPQPADGKALLRWARDASRQFGLDLVAEIHAWGDENCLLAPPNDWDIGDVTDCLASLAKMLDEKGLLDLPPEARAQMAPPEPQDRLRDLGPPGLPPGPPSPAPAAPGPQAAPVDPLLKAGPLTIHNKDPLVNLKNRLVSQLHRVGRVAFGRGLTESEAMDYLKVRLAEHQFPSIESVRNSSDRKMLHRILEALREDERDAKRNANF